MSKPQVNVVPEPDLRKALEIANQVRKIAGEDPIEYLQPGIAGNSNHCTLARTFNCGLAVNVHTEKDEVGNYKEQIWYLTTGDEASIDVHEFERQTKLLQDINAAIPSLPLEIWEDEENGMTRVILPGEVGIIASQFDEVEGVPADLLIYSVKLVESGEEINDSLYENLSEVLDSDLKAAEERARASYEAWCKERGV